MNIRVKQRLDPSLNTSQLTKYFYQDSQAELKGPVRNMNGAIMINSSYLKQHDIPLGQRFDVIVKKRGDSYTITLKSKNIDSDYVEKWSR